MFITSDAFTNMKNAWRLMLTFFRTIYPRATVLYVQSGVNYRNTVNMENLTSNVLRTKSVE